MQLFSLHTLILLFLCALGCTDTPGMPENIRNGPTMMCWEEPLVNCSAIAYYDIEYITYGIPKCRREIRTTWDLPRAKVYNITIRATDINGHQSEAQPVTLDFFTTGRHIKPIVSTFTVFCLQLIQLQVRLQIQLQIPTNHSLTETVAIVVHVGSL